MGIFSKIFGGKSTDVICAPVAGKAVPISEVSDPTFGQEILGKGIAIQPSEGKVYAPCDASVDMMFDTGHAVSLIAGNGAEILVHIGLDTVNLKGQYYKPAVKSGDTVKKGDLLIEFDKNAITQAGYDTITPIVICNSGDYTTFQTHVGQAVKPGDPIIELAK